MKFLGVLLFLGLIAQPVLAKKTLVYCAESVARKLNPQQVNDAGSIISIGYTIYDQLVTINSDTLKVEPHVAKSWSISKDGKQYTFDLRNDVKFHSNKSFKPTRTLNADDVIFSFERQWKKDHPFYEVGGGTYFLFIGLEFHKLLKKVEKLGEHKVRFTLNSRNAGFLRYLAMYFAAIQSAEYADFLAKKNMKAKIDKEPIGSGPFVFKTYKKDRILRLTKFEDYFKGATPVDQLVYTASPESSVRYQKIRNKDCHISISPPANAVAKIRNSKELELHTNKGLNIAYLALNLQKPALKNLKVRKAIAHALNRDAYIKAIYLGEGSVANHPVPPRLFGYPKGLPGHKYDPELSKKLLKEAGLEKGLKIKLWTLPIVRHYNPNGKRMGEMMQADLKKVGIDAQLVSYEWGTYLDKSDKGEHEVAQIGWAAASGDPDEFVGTLFSCDSIESGLNMSRYCDKTLDKLIKKAKAESNPKKRAKLYFDAQKRIRDQVLWIPIAHGNEHRVIRKEVKNYKLHSLKGEYLYGVDL